MTKSVPKESINYSFVPNHHETMQALARARLSGREFRLVILILNQTDGYLREQDTILPTFFQERTGISRAHLSNALARLRQWNIITQQKHTFKVNFPLHWAPEAFTYSPKTVNSPKTVSHSPKTVNPLTENGEKQIHSKDNTKDNSSKENKGPVPGPDQQAPPSKALKSSADPRVTEIMKTLEKERGWISPAYAAEASAIKWMLCHNFPPEDILACWRAMASDPWWQDKALRMMSVKNQIGNWVKKRQEAVDGTYKRGPQKAGSRPRVGTREEFARLATEQGSKPGESWERTGPGFEDAAPGM